MIYVGSLHYSPVFKSLCCALGKQLEKKGFEVKYLFNNHYKWMLSPEVMSKTAFMGNSKDIKSLILDIKNGNLNDVEKLFLQDKPEYVYLHNIHPFLNIKIAKIAKKYGSTFIQHIHEPYVKNKEIYGGIHRYWLYLFEYLQEKLLKNTDIAILSSIEALKLFNERYSDFSGKKIQIPLIYEDTGNSSNDPDDRKYINFIGPPVPAKNPEKFLEIVNYADKNNLDLEFLVVSRFKIKDKRYYNYKNLEIFHQEKISDEEIGNCMENSIMTITPYKTARQSSVAMTAYMYGAPVLATNINGLKESVEHQKTGYLIDENEDIEEIFNGINYIKNNIGILSQNCRNYFTENYSEVNWPKYFSEVFNV